MPTQVTNYQCPSCTGPLHYSSESGKLECEFCGSSYDVAEIEALYAEKNQKAEQASAAEQKKEEQKAEQQAEQRAADPDGEWAFEGDGWTEEGMKAYNCPSCGAELICDETTAATSCPYCGNPTVVPGQFAGGLKPDYIIPFKLDKKAAKEKLKKHLSGKRLLPKAFKSENHISEVKGIYVPFWLYDTDASADIRYKATKTRFWSDNDYDYTETSYYAVHRSGSLGFDHVPVDGSASMENDLMESIEPFDFKEAVDFQTAYLAGYFADKYDVTASECEERANERIRHSTEDAFRDTVRGYSSVVPENTSIRLHNGTTKYALYPVWILQTKWKGDNYIFAMNDQTGKFVGNLPTDKSAFARWFLGTTGIVGVIAYIILYLIWAL